jgi:hypothetical protein
VEPTAFVRITVYGSSSSLLSVYASDAYALYARGSDMSRLDVYGDENRIQTLGSSLDHLDVAGLGETA